ncbi:Cytochrome p450 [Thalictrum thalictroides]|uniref:Cytochrome p450 n=1 Tax=Thalictrum thalictroides TaxID=46969 RepID=A0A7J6VAD4_THATH|nr:Cytochrome p450 [Thalictrum thalictroides]
MKKTAKELDYILEGWLKEHRQSLQENGTKVEQDFMYVLLSILEDKKIFGYEAAMANKAICLQMIVAATDTTTITLTWALSLLLNNRDTLKKALEEIDITVGTDRQVNELDIEKLVYLQAIIKETLRLYPAAPLSAQHEAMEDCTVAGYHVPAGTRVITNLWKIQQDSRIWSNPTEFKPERFLTTQANVDVRGQHFEYIPFGSGRRSCPGISFALQVVHLTLARLLQSFDFKTSLDASVDMTESPGLTNIKATPLDVLITPRLSADHY